MPATHSDQGPHHEPDSPLESPADETNRMILWSSLALASILVLGLVLWSQAGSAVFFDRISGAIASCF